MFQLKLYLFKKSLILSSLVIVLGAISLVGRKPKPADDADPNKLKAENLMGTQYTEVLPVWG